MENDLYFALIERLEWKQYSESGTFNPESVATEGYIQCYEASQVEKASNTFFKGINLLYLIVIDPLRIQHPVKKATVGDIETLRIQGSVSIDAIIDRIILKRGKTGTFAVRIKHFD